MFQGLGLAFLSITTLSTMLQDRYSQVELKNSFGNDVKILAQVSEEGRSKFRIQTQIFLMPLHTPLPPCSAS